MPASKRPSFLKRQKELKRMERAAEKREAKRLKKASRLESGNGADDAPESVGEEAAEGAVDQDRD